MTSHARTLCCLLLIASGAESAAGKTFQDRRPPAGNAASPTPEGATAAARDPNPLRRQVALSTLEHLLDLSNDFDDCRAKIKVRTQIAELLWKHDEPRARRLLLDAFQEIGSLKLPANERRQLSHQVLRLIALHDTALAKKLLEEAPAGGEPEAKAHGDHSGTAEQYLRLARDIAEADPERAAQMVRASLDEGLSPWHASALVVIRHRDAALADNIFGSILSAARRQPAPPLTAIAALAWYVSPNEEEMLSGKDFASDPARRAAAIQFLDLAQEIILGQTGAGQTGAAPVEGAKLYSFLQAVMPVFDRHSPDRAAAIRARLSAAPGRVSPEQLKELSDIYSGDDVQELLNQAASARGSRQQDGYYMKAAMAALWGGDTELALSTVEKISDQQGKVLVKSIVRFQAGLRAVAKRQMDVAHQHAKEITFLPSKVELYKRIAESLLDSQDRKGASEVVEELETLLEASGDGPEKALGLLELSGTVARYDPKRGLEVLRSAVKAINKADFSRKPPDKGAAGTNLLVPIPISLEMLNFKSFSIHAAGDFEQTLTTARMLTTREASVLAQLEACRAVLNAPADSTNKPERTKKGQGQ